MRHPTFMICLGINKRCNYRAFRLLQEKINRAAFLKACINNCLGLKLTSVTYKRESVERQQRRVRYAAKQPTFLLTSFDVKRTFKADRSVLSCVVIYSSDERRIEKRNKCPRHPQRIFVGCHWKGKRAFFVPSFAARRAGWCTSTT